METSDRLEARIREIGKEIFEAMKGEVPSFFDSSRWKGKMMDWTMKDERFKIQLFRFVDALPSLRSNGEIVPLLKEYFYSEEGLLPEGIKGWLPEKGLFSSLAGKVVKSNVESLAKQFIAGRTPEEAMKTVSRLRREGRTATVDLLGEAVLSDQEAYHYLERCLGLIDALADEAARWQPDPLLDEDHMGPMPRADLSLKVSSFYARLDPMAQADAVSEVKKPLRLVMERAMERGISVTFDMEHHHLKDFTLALFRAVLEEFPDAGFAGIAIQTYLKDAEEDLKALIGWATKKNRRIGVRLVKGAYWDYEKVINAQAGWPVPVFLTKGGTDGNFERMTRLMLDNRACIRPAIASHNIRSIACAMTIAEETALPKKGIEFQALFGMAEPIKSAVAGRGYRVREYLPVGEFLPGMAYLVRRLLENTSNESFLRQSFVEKIDFDALMAPPDQATASPPEEPCGERGFRNIPLLDFSKEQARTAFAVELAAFRSRLADPEKVPLVIGKEKIFTDDETASFNPARDGERVAIVSAADAAHGEAAVRTAREALQTWRVTAPERRADILKKAADWMTSRRASLAAMQVFEVGKSWKEADADVAEAIDFLNFYATEALTLAIPERLGNYPGELNHQCFVPRGVAAVIAPWNFPLAIACGMAAAAIATGNTVVLKPSSLSPLTAFRIVEAFEAAGLPPGVLNFLPGPGETTGRFLIDHPDIDLIVFTGSMEVGLDIAERAGRTVPGQRNVKKVIAEMGGKNAVIVDKTADLDEAVKGIVASFTGFQGQKCSACSRVIVVGDVYDDFLKRLTQTVKSLTIGPPEDPANIIGPMIDARAAEKVRRYIAIGREEATLHYLAEHLPPDGSYAPLAIFTGVKPKCRIAQEEIFGPVLAVMQAADINEAIGMANGTPYALTAGIYSRSPGSIDRARQELRAGNIYINRKITGALVGRQPFGGYGMSGLGSKAGGSDYLKHFVFPVCISENTLRRGFAPEE